MFIDSSYFVGEINIPNADKNATSLTQAIGQYEKEILIQLLGYKLYAALVADCTNGVPANQIYKDLVEGAEFTIAESDVTLKWEGLKNDSKQSLLAYFTFYKYVERDITHLSGTGVILTPSGKGSRASSVNKLINAWERMRTLYGITPPNYRPFFTGPVKGSSLPCVFNYDPSAYNFLFANRANYPDWIFTPQWNINAFGI
ncbi:MAG: hypothetical protein JZU49_04840 [Sulfuricurvum sp.]|jgi:hypothetical protein|nr:hypothetical protein [Sulfuricurvum sp.]